MSDIDRWKRHFLREQIRFVMPFILRKFNRELITMHQLRAGYYTCSDYSN